MYDILGTEVSWDEIRCRVIVYGLGIFIGVGLFCIENHVREEKKRARTRTTQTNLLPNIGPLLEHFGVIRQRDILALLVEHDLGGEGGDYAEGALHPHLRH